MPVVKYSENPLLSVDFSPEELARLREVKNNPDRQAQQHRKKWTDDETEALTRLAGDLTTREIAEAMGRDRATIRRRAKHHGMKLGGRS